MGMETNIHVGPAAKGSQVLAQAGQGISRSAHTRGEYVLLY